MQTTPNYGFKKPDGDDFINHEDWADMMDQVDAALHDAVQDAEDVVEDAENAAQQVIGDKADKSILITATAAAKSWTGSKEPYLISIAIKELTGTPDELVEVFIPYTATTEQKMAWSEAMISGGDNQAGTLTLEALGDKPTIDIPLCILKRGDLKGVIKCR